MRSPGLKYSRAKERAMTTEMTRIDWADVRPGDVLMHENGDRVTVTNVSDSKTFTRTTIALEFNTAWDRAGFKPHRPKPDLTAVPTVPDAYHDKDGVLCSLAVHRGSWPWIVIKANGEWERVAVENMTARAPFTRLVPMPTEEQLRSVGIAGDDADAVMSLLAGESGE